MIIITLALIILFALSKANKIRLGKRTEVLILALIVILVVVQLAMVLLSIQTGTGVEVKQLP